MHLPNLRLAGVCRRCFALAVAPILGFGFAAPAACDPAAKTGLDRSSFADYARDSGLSFVHDNDGAVDLYVTNWGANQLWRNRGDGTFEEVGQRSGTADPGWGTSASFFDFDRDGWLEFYVANDQQENFLWLNLAGKGFREEALLAGAAVSLQGLPEASMGLVAADLDNGGFRLLPQSGQPGTPVDAPFAHFSPCTRSGSERP